MNNPAVSALIFLISLGSFAPRVVAGDPLPPAVLRAPPAANRELDPETLKRIVELSDVLIDKRSNSGERWKAANRFGRDLAHKYAIPALVLVLRDPTDNERVRQKCVIALSRIRDERVVDYLIEAILDRNVNVATQAEVQLRMLTGQRFEPDFKLPPAGTEARRKHQDRWRAWWGENRGRVVLRDAAGTR